MELGKGAERVKVCGRRRGCYKLAGEGGVKAQSCTKRKAACDNGGCDKPARKTGERHEKRKRDDDLKSGTDGSAKQGNGNPEHCETPLLD